MTNFMAIKIHYDHRKSLAPHLKYSKIASPEEYKKYLKLYDEGKGGGNGFHECLNYYVPENGNVQMYLPPNYFPAKSTTDQEFVIFSFTYKSDLEMPSRIVGVHAGATLMGRNGIRREGVGYIIKGIEERLSYHVEAPQNLVTLFTPPIEYNYGDEKYTPKYQTWGYGLRYIKASHAKNIIKAALKGAENGISTASVSERQILDRQVEVLNEISKRYFSVSSPSKGSGRNSSKANSPNGGGAPDQEIGRLGEKLVYERELAHAKSIGAEPRDVEWTSQGNPQSSFDIKSVRKDGDELVEHFIEVKSSRASDDSNIYVSSRQVEFFKANEKRGSLVFVSFEQSGALKEIRDLSLSQLLGEFELCPIKFKLQKK